MDSYEERNTSGRMRHQSGGHHFDHRYSESSRNTGNGSQNRHNRASFPQMRPSTPHWECKVCHKIFRNGDDLHDHLREAGHMVTLKKTQRPSRDWTPSSVSGTAQKRKTDGFICMRCDDEFSSKIQLENHITQKGHRLPYKRPRQLPTKNSANHSRDDTDTYHQQRRTNSRERHSTRSDSSDRKSNDSQTRNNEDIPNAHRGTGKLPLITSKDEILLKPMNKTTACDIGNNSENDVLTQDMKDAQNLASKHRGTYLGTQLEDAQQITLNLGSAKSFKDVTAGETSQSTHLEVSVLKETLFLITSPEDSSDMPLSKAPEVSSTSENQNAVVATIPTIEIHGNDLVDPRSKDLYSTLEGSEPVVPVRGFKWTPKSVCPEIFGSNTGKPIAWKLIPIDLPQPQRRTGYPIKDNLDPPSAQSFSSACSISTEVPTNHITDVSIPENSSRVPLPFTKPEVHSHFSPLIMTVKPWSRSTPNEFSPCVTSTSFITEQSSSRCSTPLLDEARSPEKDWLHQDSRICRPDSTSLTSSALKTSNVGNSPLRMQVSEESGLILHLSPESTAASPIKPIGSVRRQSVTGAILPSASSTPLKLSLPPPLKSLSSHRLDLPLPGDPLSAHLKNVTEPGVPKNAGIDLDYTESLECASLHPLTVTVQQVSEECSECQSSFDVSRMVVDFTTGNVSNTCRSCGICTVMAHAFKLKKIKS